MYACILIYIYIIYIYIFRERDVVDYVLFIVMLFIAAWNCVLASSNSADRTSRSISFECTFAKEVDIWVMM